MENFEFSSLYPSDEIPKYQKNSDETEEDYYKRMDNLKKLIDLYDKKLNVNKYDKRGKIK
jgi:hypothetical protein